MAALRIDVEKVVARAESQLGVHEDPFGSNNQPYGRWYGMNWVAWCAIFFSWCAYFAGFPLRISTSKGASFCPSVVEWAKRMGYWRDSDSDYQPKRGDGVIFDFIGRPSHIGWVTGRTSDGRVITVEGNTNGAGGRTGGMVMRHYRSRRGSTIGYVCVEDVKAKPPLKPKPPPKVQWVLGDTGADVRLFQQCLNVVAKPMGLGDQKPLVVNGRLDERTNARFHEFEVKYRWLQDRSGATPKLRVDYVFSRATVAALSYAVARVKKYGRY